MLSSIKLLNWLFDLINDDFSSPTDLTFVQQTFRFIPFILLYSHPPVQLQVTEEGETEMEAETPLLFMVL